MRAQPLFQGGRRVNLLRQTLQVEVGLSLLVDEHGWVAHTVGVAPRDRIGVPSADQPLTVPGLGLCLPAPLADGWLVRPSGDQDRRIVLTLDLSAAPCIEVSGCQRQWRSSVTTRHAEILTLLHSTARTRSIPVIVCSVVRQEELALGLGASLYIAKPVGRQDFIQALDRVLPLVKAAEPTSPASNGAAS